MLPVSLLALLAVASAETPPETARERRPFAVWTDPQLFFHGLGAGRADFAGSDLSAYPLGIELGRQVGPHLLLSVALGRRPWHDIEGTQATLGGRWYFRTGTVAPYVAGELGWKREEVDDTGGLTHSDFFAGAGPGAEVTLGWGLSLSTDFLIGPENSREHATTARAWFLSGWYRVGIGYRF